ncbi:MAG: aspartate dehydrogenase [Candidatus Hadarchaeales archaeon]
MLGIAIIGCGAIGSTLAKAICEGRAGEAELIWVYDIVKEKAILLSNRLEPKPKIAKSVREICADRGVQLVIEAASQLAVEQYSEEILNSGKDLMVMSVGALADEKLFRRLLSLAEKKGRRIFVPSGAIVGVDGAKAAAVGEIKEVVLTTRKPPKAFASISQLRRQRLDLSKIKKAKVIFDGPASEAVKIFPASVNVAATLALATIGVKKTRVRVVADPSIKRNIHEIKIIGDCGEITTVANNLPFPESPRTSYLAALSAIRMLRNMTEPLQLGS